MKKIIALILAFALMLGAMPFAFAAEHDHDEDCCGLFYIGPTKYCDCLNPAPYYKFDGVNWIGYCLNCGEEFAGQG